MSKYGVKTRSNEEKGDKGKSNESDSTKDPVLNAERKRKN